MPRRSNKDTPVAPWHLLLQAATVAYPFAVFFLINRLPLWMFLAGGLLLGAAQMFRMRHNPFFTGILPMAATGAALLILLYFISAQHAVQAYPIFVSLGFAAAFALSLRFPPSVAERVARLHEPDLPPEGVRYTRRVTWVWLIFLLANAATSCALMLWGTLAQWTLWCGLLSYVAMGLLFAGEYAIRRTVRR